MEFVYGKQDLRNMQRAQESCWLLTNGLGGYASASAACSVTRGDCGLLISAETAPCKRNSLVYRIQEMLTVGENSVFLSTQEFEKQAAPEGGFRYLSSFWFDTQPHWRYEAFGVLVERTIKIGQGVNEIKVSYRITNRSGRAACLQVTPYFSLVTKGQSRHEVAKTLYEDGKIACGKYHVFLKSNCSMKEIKPVWQKLYFRDDEVDGRDPSGMSFAVVQTEVQAGPDAVAELELYFSDNGVFTEQWKRTIPKPFQSSVANHLAQSANDFISLRTSTGGKTIVAGYPFFGDWGRDTMIALPGCTLSTGQYETAKSILTTFLQYEKDGLVPNLFPEGDEEPRYNTVDAALLLINALWLYYEKTENVYFLKSAFPVMKRIISAYRTGTHHGIGMDQDGLIYAGKGLDQVTWMDVCVDGILPTPRHGKPVEINAYWYNALKIMEHLSILFGEDGSDYEELARKVQKSFREKFWHPAGYLRDVLSGTDADDQIRCNQIWAVTMPFCMLSPEQEKSVVETVYRELYTPCGLRTLSPKDSEFHPNYGGSQKLRDLAYHQGTVWVFPLGAYYRAYLKVNKYTEDAVNEVYRGLSALESMLREGCIGQLPEIYDGSNPTASRGCFAQAWSVGEMLTVYEELEAIERRKEKGL